MFGVDPALGGLAVAVLGGGLAAPEFDVDALAAGALADGEVEVEVALPRFAAAQCIRS